MDKILERLALDRLGCFDYFEVVYTKKLSKKKREFKIRYNKGEKYVEVTYQGDDTGGVEVVEIKENI
uniref:Uncharacterized protein n=1 Tax=Salmonella phage vB_SEnST11_KE22 TaxID=3161173 RepID=A0AAU8GF07_9CAUD